MTIFFVNQQSQAAGPHPGVLAPKGEGQTSDERSERGTRKRFEPADSKGRVRRLARTEGACTQRGRDRESGGCPMNIK